MEYSLKKLALGLTLALAFVAPVKAAEIAQAIGPFSGLNNADNSLILSASQAQDLLNVDVQKDGKSIKKRKGYGLAFTLAITTSATHGIYSFYDANANDVSLFFHDRYLQASVGGAAVTTVFSTGTLAATWQCTDSQGFAYCASSARDIIIKTNGVTYSWLSAAPQGTIVASTPERLLVAGTAANPQRIAFSKANDFTTWTTGSQATDPNTEDILAPGSKITHLTYAFGRIIWFKDSSFGAILGTDNTNWQIVTISPNIGTLDNTSVYYGGVLYFRAQDGHIYAYDGGSLTKLTRDIQGTISTSASRRSNAWTITSQSDFQTGQSSQTLQLSTTISPGDVVPSSFSATDTSTADFSAGTNNNTTVQSNSVYIVTNSTGLLNSGFESGTTKDAITNWTGYSNPSGMAYFSANTVLTNCTVSAYDGSKYVGYGDNTANAGKLMRVRVHDGFTDAILYSQDNTFSSNNCVFSTKTLTVSSTDFGRNVYVSFVPGYSGGLYSEGYKSTRFQLGGNITYHFASDNLSGTSYTFVDGFNTGRSSYTTAAFTSRSFDTGWQYGYGQISSYTYTANTSTPTVLLQTSANNSTWTDLGTSTTTSYPIKRYIRYISTFTLTSSDNGLSTLNDVTLLARSSGTYLSAVKNAPSLTSWDTFTASIINNSGSHTFYMRSSTNSFTVTSTTPTWTAVTNGAVVSISTGTFFQLRDDIAITASTHTPTLSDFTINWFEGSANDKAYATYFADAVWWATTVGAGASANNDILRYDLVNNCWTLYDIGTNGMLVRNGSLYFGSASGGYIYKFGDATSDNGAAINAYWKSKDFIGESPFTDKEFRSISISASSVANSTGTVTYTVNGSSSSAYNVYLYNPNASFIKHNKNLPLGRNGSYFNIKFGNNAADQPFELFGMQFTFEPKPWSPTQ